MAFRCLQQIAAITRTEENKVVSEDGKWIAETLQDVTTTASALVSQKEGNFGEPVEEIGGR